MTITSVRCKMHCHDLGQATPEGAVTKVQLGAVYSADLSENGDFARATPWGTCVVGIDNGKPAADFFKPGKKYYVTFTEAPD